MDADILRLILFIAGVGLILGIYFWDRHKKVTARVHAIRKAQQAMPESAGEAAERIEPAWHFDESEFDKEADRAEEEIRQPEGQEDELLEWELNQLSRVALDDEDEEVDQQQTAFSFSADEEEAEALFERDDLPIMILQINVVSTQGPFTGEQVMQAARDVDLVYGDMKIFHRYTQDKQTSRVLFSMASMVEPGVFPLEEMERFSTPGMVLFGQLPGPKDGLATFSDMLFTAERLASLLGGELQDETHSVLSKQTIEHIREKILEHRRQVQLALSK